MNGYTQGLIIGLVTGFALGGRDDGDVVSMMARTRLTPGMTHDEVCRQVVR